MNLSIALSTYSENFFYLLIDLVCGLRLCLRTAAVIGLLSITRVNVSVECRDDDDDGWE
jgi:hypothetical protein